MGKNAGNNAAVGRLELNLPRNISPFLLFQFAGAAIAATGTAVAAIGAYYIPSDDSNENQQATKNIVVVIGALIAAAGTVVVGYGAHHKSQEQKARVAEAKEKAAEEASAKPVSATSSLQQQQGSTNPQGERRPAATQTPKYFSFYPQVEQRRQLDQQRYPENYDQQCDQERGPNFSAV